MSEASRVVRKPTPAPTPAARPVPRKAIVKATMKPTTFEKPVPRKAVPTRKPVVHRPTPTVTPVVRKATVRKPAVRKVTPAAKKPVTRKATPTVKPVIRKATVRKPAVRKVTPAPRPVIRKATVRKPVVKPAPAPRPVSRCQRLIARANRILAPHAGVSQRCGTPVVGRGYTEFIPDESEFARAEQVIQLAGRTDAQVVLTIVHENAHTRSEMASERNRLRAYALVGLTSRDGWWSGGQLSATERYARSAEECLVGTNRQLPTYSCSTYRQLARVFG